MKKTLCILATASIAFTTTGCEEFQNCDDLRSKFPHGVGMPGAIDSTSDSTPVTTFEVNDVYYKFNDHLDRDNDGIACERA